VDRVFVCLHTARLLAPAQTSASAGPSVGGAGRGALRGYRIRLPGYRFPVVITVYDTPADARAAASALRSLLKTTGGFTKSIANVLEFSSQKVPEHRLAPIERCARS
jgi:hypothetical protein